MVPAEREPGSTPEPGVWLEDVWVKYLVRYHRPSTLRGLVANRAVGALLARVQSLLKPNGSNSRESDFWALRGISFSAAPGDILGIVGSNGAGKSTLLRVVARIIKPDRGTATVAGSLGSLLSFGAGFNPDLTGRENLFLNGAILGLTTEQIRERLPDMIELADIGDFFDAPVSTYSSGMRARLGFAVAVHVNPDVLVIDEVVQVGDAFFQRKAGTVLDRFRDQGKIIIIVTHAPAVVQRYCNRAIWMEHGKMQSEGDPKSVAAEYLQWSEARLQMKGAGPSTASGGSGMK